jgi:hypothetical protein
MNQSWKLKKDQKLKDKLRDMEIKKMPVFGNLG